MKRLILLSVFTSLFCVSSAAAGWYLHPRIGAFVPIHDGDTSYSIGGSLGYAWTKMFATEARYSRIMGTPSGDILTGNGIVTLPIPMFAPYGSVGIGTVRTSAAGSSHWNTIVPIGAGVTIGPLLFLTLSAGVDYDIVRGGPDFLEPGVSIGFGF
ncbi:MAG: hypothetical protein V1798_08640 [Pseudomonadota bacterium]